jgi:hypothetical protein
VRNYSSYRDYSPSLEKALLCSKESMAISTASSSCSSLKSSYLNYLGFMRKLMFRLKDILMVA